MTCAHVLIDWILHTHEPNNVPTAQAFCIQLILCLKHRGISDLFWQNLSLLNWLLLSLFGALISSLSHPPYIIIIFSVSLEVVMSSSSAEPRARSRLQPPRSTMNRNCRPPEIQLVNNWYSRRRESESAREGPRYPVSHQLTGLINSLWSAVASENKHKIRSRQSRDLPIESSKHIDRRGDFRRPTEILRAGEGRNHASIKRSPLPPS